MGVFEALEDGDLAVDVLAGGSVLGHHDLHRYMLPCHGIDSQLHLAGGSLSEGLVQSIGSHHVVGVGSAHLVALCGLVVTLCLIFSYTHWACHRCWHSGCCDHRLSVLQKKVPLSLYKQALIGGIVVVVVLGDGVCGKLK